MIDLVMKGGPVMWPILLCAIIAISIMCERIVFFIFTAPDKYYRGNNKACTFEKLPEKYKDKSVESSFSPFISATSWLKYFLRGQSAIDILVITYLENISEHPSKRDIALSMTGKKEITKMEKHSRLLEGIATITPLLGLLGTITGLITCFITISQKTGSIDHVLLSQGIWQAMVTTAAGLIVAIPVYLVNCYFQSIIDYRSDLMSYVVDNLNKIYFRDE